MTGDDWRGRQAVSDFPAALRPCLWKCVFSLWRACVRDAEWCCLSVVDSGVTGDDWRGRQLVSDFPGALRFCGSVCFLSGMHAWC